VRYLRKRAPGARLFIDCEQVLDQLQAGGSVAVNGVCLTCEELDSQGFAASLLGETLAVSNLGRLKSGARVNLELPLRMGDPIGGHLLQGHVDASLAVLSFPRARAEQDATLVCELPEELKPFVFSGASIGLNGVSLTVRSVVDAGFSVNLIPETLARTNLGELKAGAEVNCEVDLIIKSVYHSLQVRAAKGELSSEALGRLGYD